MTQHNTILFIEYIHIYIYSGMSSVIHGSSNPMPRTPRIPISKLGLSAFMFYCRDNRDKIKAEFPEMGVTQVTAEVSKRWKELPEDGRTPYRKMADNDHKRAVHIYVLRHQVDSTVNGACSDAMRF